MTFFLRHHICIQYTHMHTSKHINENIWTTYQHEIMRDTMELLSIKTRKNQGNSVVTSTCCSFNLVLGRGYALFWPLSEPDTHVVYIHKHMYLVDIHVWTEHSYKKKMTLTTTKSLLKPRSTEENLCNQSWKTTEGGKQAFIRGTVTLSKWRSHV